MYVYSIHEDDVDPIWNYDKITIRMPFGVIGECELIFVSLQSWLQNLTHHLEP